VLLALVCLPMAAGPGPLALGLLVMLVGAVLAPLHSTAYVLAAELAPLLRVICHEHRTSLQMGIDQSGRTDRNRWTVFIVTR